MSCFLNISENGTLVPSVGIFNRCTRIRGQSNCAVFAMDGLATDSVVFPTMWKVLITLYTNYSISKISYLNKYLHQPY